MCGAVTKGFRHKEAFCLALNDEKGWVVDFSRQPVAESMDYKEEKKQGGCSGWGKLAEAGLVVSLHFMLHLAI